MNAFPEDVARAFADLPGLPGSAIPLLCASPADGLDTRGADRSLPVSLP